MAHSIQIVGNRTESFNDLDLLVLMHLLLEKLEQEGDRFASLAAVREVWRRALFNYGPGIIDLELESFYNDEAKKRDFLSALAAVETNVLCYESSGQIFEIDLKWLVPHANVCKKYQKSFILNGIEKIRNLLS